MKITTTKVRKIDNIFTKLFIFKASPKSFISGVNNIKSCKHGGLKLVLIVCLFLGQMKVFSQQNIANFDVTLQGGTTAMSVAWHPLELRYYTSSGGNASSPVHSFDSNGNLLSGPSSHHFDNRGLWYNPVSELIEGSEFGSGQRGFYPLASGTPSGSIVTAGYGSGLPNTQSGGVLNTSNGEVLFYSGGNNFFRYSLTSGQLGTVGITVPGSSVFNQTHMIYTGIPGSEVGFYDYVNRRVYFYSIAGGRFVLSIIPYFTERIKSVQLLAPDGLNDKNFYSWSQRRWWARRLFERWTRKPMELLRIASVLSSIRIIHPKIVDFLRLYISDKSKILHAYQTWFAFRNLRPNPKLIRWEMDKHLFSFVIIIGEFDRIITKKSAQDFLMKIGRPNGLIVIPAGHDFFREDLIWMIKKELMF